MGFGLSGTSSAKPTSAPTASRSSFSTVTASRHLAGSMNRGCCYPGGGRTQEPLHEPNDLQCLLCEFHGSDLKSYQFHVRIHFPRELSIYDRHRHCYIVAGEAPVSYVDARAPRLDGQAVRAGAV
eukprot:2985535-Pyramimonas_sp.AAC.1